MAPVQTRRSRKLREATYIDGQHNSLMKELSTPNKDGSIPLLNFLENTTKFVHDTQQLHDRMIYLEKEHVQYKKLQTKYNSIVQYLEQITRKINKQESNDDIPLEYFKEDDDEEEEEEEEESVAAETPMFFESNPDSRDIAETPNKDAHHLQYTNKHKSSDIESANQPRLLSNYKGSRKRRPTSWEQLSAQEDINTLLDEDLRKLEELSKEMKLRPSKPDTLVIKNTRKSGKNRGLLTSPLDKFEEEDAQPKSEYSLKKSSRGAKLRKIYESNLQLNKQMADEMQELEKLRQYLLQDEE